MVSMRTKNGFSQSGAPPGKRLAAKVLGLWAILEMMRESHKGKPRATEKIRCLENLNV